jgi:hypothetical protein
MRLRDQEEVLPLSSRGRVWSSAVHVVPDGFVPGDPLGAPVRLFRPRGAGWPGALHTIADPFLLARGDRLYLFAEAQAARRPGRILGWSTTDLESWEPLGTILAAPHHLSYPFVFERDGAVWMIPESAWAGEVALYRFADFPRRPEKVRVLLRGAYFDSSLCEGEDGGCYLFTSSAAGLHLFRIGDLLGDEPAPHPIDPITADPARSRCGGAPIRADGALFRLAQNGSARYGEGLSAWRVNRLTSDDYREAIHSQDLLGERRGWNAAGGHHMSLARFGGRTVVAVDGQADEPWLPWLAKQPARTVAGAARRLARRVR